MALLSAFFLRSSELKSFNDPYIVTSKANRFLKILLRTYIFIPKPDKASWINSTY